MKVTVAIVGWLPTAPPGARGAVTSTPSRTRLGLTSSSRDLRHEVVAGQPSGPVAGFVVGVDTGVPEIVVACPRYTSEVAT